MAPSRRVISQRQILTHPFLSNTMQWELVLPNQASLLFLKEVSVISGITDFQKKGSLALSRTPFPFCCRMTEIYSLKKTILCFSVCYVLVFQPTLPVGPLQEGQKQRMRSGMIPGSWQHRLKLQLFLKASKAYYVLSDAATNLLKYGRALRYIKLSLQCYGKVHTCHYCCVLDCCVFSLNYVK